MSSNDTEKINEIIKTIRKKEISQFLEKELSGTLPLFFASTFCIKLQNIFVGCCKTVL